MLDGGQARAAGLPVATDADVGRVRYAYMPGATARELAVETLSLAESLREDAMLGLRMTDGIPDSLAVRAGVEPALESLVADGLVEHVGNTWRTTERGWLLGNEVFGRVWTGV
jgi:coproporphyrinogen III oxidase-like Fe-S oxidoreductase